MKIKLFIIFLVIFTLLSPRIAMAQTTPSPSTNSQSDQYMQNIYKYIEWENQHYYPQAQPVNTTKKQIDPPNTTPSPTPFNKNPNANPQDIKRLFNLWLASYHIKTPYNLPIQVILLGIIAICLGSLGLIAYFRFMLFRKALAKNEADKVFLSLKAPVLTEKSAFATEQLFEFIHSHYQVVGQSIWRKLLIFLGFPIRKKTISLEIVSTKEDGIRYIIQTTKKDASALEKTILSHVPGVKIERSDDYLPKKVDSGKYIAIAEYALSNHFSIPLQDLKALVKFDPIAYITGHMTKLNKDEMIAMQVILTPVSSLTHLSIAQTIIKLQNRIWNELTIKDILKKQPFPRKVLTIFFRIIIIWLLLWIYIAAVLIHFITHFFIKGEGPILNWWPFGGRPKKVIKTPKQELLYKSISSKIDGSLFEGSLRLFVAMNDSHKVNERVDGFTSSLSPFSNPSLQSIIPQRDGTEKFWELLDFTTRKNYFHKFLWFKLRNRLLSFDSESNPYFSVSEATDLYHLPYPDSTKTENLVKSKSPELPAPLILKQEQNDFANVFGVNTYGGEDTPIGLTEKQKKGHFYMVGQTGMGKSTVFANMIRQDILAGRGVGVIDAHGELIDWILTTIPKNRIKDVVYFNPSDTKFPVGLNFMELDYSLDPDDLDMQKDLIRSSLISLFRKLYLRIYSGPRMEYILRNLCTTAWATKDPTIFTLQRILDDEDYRKAVVATLKDSVLKRFWEGQINKLGDYQVQEYISPIVNKIGRFQEISMSKHILGQKKSTINFSDILNEGKILLCNLSEGKIGEDNTEMFGTLLLLQLEQAALKRANIPPSQRKQFNLYVDEFQTFATESFGKILSGSRKYGLTAYLTHQDTAQIKEPELLRIILANSSNFVVFRTADPSDEKLILPIFSPEVEKNQILNLARHHFYMKINGDDAEDAFSGTSLDFTVKGDPKTAQEVIEYSRAHYTTPKEKVAKEMEKSLSEPFEKAEEKEKEYKEHLRQRKKK